MEEQRWYEADALMPDSTSHRHTMRGVSEEEIAERMRARYAEAVVVLVRSDLRGTSIKRQRRPSHKRR